LRKRRFWESLWYKNPIFEIGAHLTVRIGESFSRLLKKSVAAAP